MTELSPEARRLLGLARRGDDPLVSDRARMNHRMARRLAVAMGVTGTALGSSKAASGALALSTLLGKGVATGLVLTAVTVGSLKATDHFVSHHDGNATTLANPTSRRETRDARGAILSESHEASMPVAPA